MPSPAEDYLYLLSTPEGQAYLQQYFPDQDISKTFAGLSGHEAGSLIQDRIEDAKFARIQGSRDKWASRSKADSDLWQTQNGDGEILNDPYTRRPESEFREGDVNDSGYGLWQEKKRSELHVLSDPSHWGRAWDDMSLEEKLAAGPKDKYIEKNVATAKRAIEGQIARDHKSNQRTNQVYATAALLAGGIAASALAGAAAPAATSVAAPTATTVAAPTAAAVAAPTATAGAAPALTQAAIPTLGVSQAVPAYAMGATGFAPAATGATLGSTATVTAGAQGAGWLAGLKNAWTGMSAMKKAGTLASAASQAYSAYQNAKSQKAQADFMRDEALRAQAWEADRVNRIRNGPLAKLAPFLMQDALSIYGGRGSGMNINQVMNMMGVADLNGMTPFTGFNGPQAPVYGTNNQPGPARAMGAQ